MRMFPDLTFSDNNYKFIVPNMADNSLPLSIGIDVSKASLDICFLYNLTDKTRGSEFIKISNNPNGWKALVDILLSKKVSSDTPIVCESTGGYHIGVAMSLKKGGYLIKVVNPLVASSYSKMDVRKTKTDRIDSLKLARLAIDRSDIPVFDLTSSEISSKKVLKLKSHYQKMRQSLKNVLHSLTDQTISSICDLTEEVETVRDTIDHIDGVIKELEIKMMNNEKMRETIKTTGHIAGVSDTSLGAIATHLGNIDKFQSAKQVVAYAGLDPSTFQSGTSVNGKSRISKRGSTGLRRSLFQIAWGLVMHNEDFKAYYQKKRAEGKHYYTCLIAVARRFLIRLYTVLKNRTKYIDPIPKVAKCT